MLRPSSGMNYPAGLGCAQGRAWSCSHISAGQIVITPYFQAAALGWKGAVGHVTKSDLFAALERFTSLSFPLFPTVRGIGIAGYSQIWQSCPFTLCAWHGAHSAMMPVLICSLGLGHSPFSSKEQVSLLVCSHVSHSGAQSKAGLGCSTSACAWAVQGCDSWLWFLLGDEHSRQALHGKEGVF